MCMYTDKYFYDIEKKGEVIYLILWFDSSMIFVLFDSTTIFASGDSCSS